MSTLEDFDAQVKSIVAKGKLSEAAVTSLTTLAMSLISSDAHLVSTLIRASKKASSSSKITSLYLIDAIAREARSKAKKVAKEKDKAKEDDTEGSQGEVKGTYATFLAKLEGVLAKIVVDCWENGPVDHRTRVVMLRQMILEGDGSVGLMEAVFSEGNSSKVRKVLDIWTRGSTFSSSALAKISNKLLAASTTAAAPSSTSPRDPPPSINSPLKPSASPIAPKPGSPIVSASDRRHHPPGLTPSPPPPIPKLLPEEEASAGPIPASVRALLAASQPAGPPAPVPTLPTPTSTPTPTLSLDPRKASVAPPAPTVPSGPPGLSPAVQKAIAAAKLAAIQGAPGYRPPPSTSAAPPPAAAASGLVLDASQLAILQSIASASNTPTPPRSPPATSFHQSQAFSNVNGRGPAAPYLQASTGPPYQQNQGAAPYAQQQAGYGGMDSNAPPSTSHGPPSNSYQAAPGYGAAPPSSAGFAGPVRDNGFGGRGGGAGVMGGGPGRQDGGYGDNSTRGWNDNGGSGWNEGGRGGGRGGWGGDRGGRGGRGRGRGEYQGSGSGRGGYGGNEQGQGWGNGNNNYNKRPWNEPHEQRAPPPGGRAPLPPGLDEFGRAIRQDAEDDGDDRPAYRRPRSVTPVTVSPPRPPPSQNINAPSAYSNTGTGSVHPAPNVIGTSYPHQPHSAAPAPTPPLSTPAAATPPMFDPTTFNAADPASWASLANYMQASMGYTPTNEQMMGWVMSSMSMMQGNAAVPGGQMGASNVVGQQQ